MSRGAIRALGATVFALPFGLAAVPAHAANIADVIAKHGQFETLSQVIDAAGLTEELAGEGPYTVFAPTDEAFARLPDGALDELLSADQEQIRSVLAMHVVEGEEIRPEDVAGEQISLSTLAGEELTVDGTTQVLLIVPTGLTVAQVGDRLVVQRDAVAIPAPAVEVRPEGAAGDQEQPAARLPQEPEQQAPAPVDPTADRQQPRPGEQPLTPLEEELADAGRPSAEDVAEAADAADEEVAASTHAADMPADELAETGLLREATIVEANIEADNGIVHAIDAVLMPQDIVALLEGEEGVEEIQQQ